MSDDRFKDAFLEGLSAADKANKNRDEAEGAIRTFAKSIEAAIGGNIRVYLDTTTIEKALATSQYLSVALGHAEVRRESTHGIFAQVQVEKTSGPTERLCLVTFAPMSYPVQIQWTNDIRICSSSDALLSALEALAADPDTGRKFRRLIAARDERKRAAIEGLEPEKEPE